ncbi:MAG: Mut7-C RNAse domain-containing protein [Desulfurococcales archaeon]|nr:Mut7-C RNAse domain-containing protein [Desulfurococcales archaeon]
MAERRQKSFIVDTMLGDVAKWLRLLGYDTLYSRTYTDNQILEIARRTGRIIVTRDRNLYWRARRRGLRAILVTGDTLVERLAEVAYYAGIRLKPDPARSRCPECNAPLKQVSKEMVKDRVPPKSYEAYDKFYVCPRCGRVYWEGGHWKNIRRIAAEAEEVARRIREERRRFREAGRPRRADRGGGDNSSQTS